MEEQSKKKRNPWSFIPSQYFAEGIPYVLVNQLSTAMFKSLEASNAFIGLTSFLNLPWSLKLFWSPLVDANITKRGWVIWMQFLISACFGIIAFVLHLQVYMTITLVVLTLIAFLSATHDIATDGFYLHALDNKDQAFFSGIRSAFYRLAMIIGGGVLVSVAGAIGEKTGNVKSGWSLAFGLSAGIFLLMALYHKYILPFPVTDKAVRTETSKVPYAKIFKEYFSQKSIGVILAFILLFRFGEGMLLKMAQPFMLDSASKGGLALSLKDVGIMYGTVGILALVGGGIIGGWLIKKYSLKKMIWTLVICMHAPNVLYIYLAAVMPKDLIILNMTWFTSIFGGSDWFITLRPLIQSCIVVEQFGYGLGFTAFMVYLLYLAKGEYKTSHYAISTGIMAVGLMVPGLLSGFVQQQFGYVALFVVSSIMTVPGMVAIFFLPIEETAEVV